MLLTLSGIQGKAGFAGCVLLDCQDRQTSAYTDRACQGTTQAVICSVFVKRQICNTAFIDLADDEPMLCGLLILTTCSDLNQQISIRGLWQRPSNLGYVVPLTRSTMTEI